MSWNPPSDWTRITTIDAHAAGAVGTVRRGHLDQHGVNVGNIDGRRLAVIEQGRVAQAAVLVVHHLFEQAVADTLRDAALDLALDRHRVDRLAHILHGHVVGQLDVAGVCIDLHTRELHCEARRLDRHRHRAPAEHG